jgi:hypothetical protein
LIEGSKALDPMLLAALFAFMDGDLNELVGLLSEDCAN